jgi:methylase of polypeptide subunit release factors
MAATDRHWYDSYISCWGREEPSQFPRALARNIPIQPGVTRLLDIGCGSGVIGIYSLIEPSKKAQSVTFNDLEPRWLDVTRCNVDIKIREGAIRQSQVKFLKAGDLAQISVEEVGQHDLVAFNPPQLPYSFIDEKTRQKIESDPIERHFRRGGKDGLDIARLFFEWYASLQGNKPDAVILLSSFLGRKLIDKTIASYGLQQKEKPKETPATLREMFWTQADEFSHSRSEMDDRSIEKGAEGWQKKLLTFRLASE